MSQGGEGVFMITLLYKLEAAQAEIERQQNTIKHLSDALAKVTFEAKAASASPVQPSQAWPKVSIELPQDDTRTVTVFWTEFRG